MPFLTKADLTTVIYQEDIDVITEADDTKVDSAIAAGIAEAQGYLSRYDIVTLFAATGDQRDPILLESCKALSLFFLTKACPPNQNIKDIKADAATARIWLDRVRSGVIKPLNWPAVSPAENANLFHVASNCKRHNNY